MQIGTVVLKMTAINCSAKRGSKLVDFIAMCRLFVLELKDVLRTKCRCSVPKSCKLVRYLALS